MYAVMISAAITSFRRRVLRVLLQQPLPEQVFDISRSIEIILAPIIGGVGTLVGPILGAFVLTGLGGDADSAMAHLGLDLPGASRWSTASVS